MGARGKLAEFPVSVEISLSEVQKYALEQLALERGESQAGTVRYLIDRERKSRGGQAQEAQPGQG